MVYQDVTRNNNIKPAAKGLYAYLASFCGCSDECYPSIDTITREMGISKDTFYKQINSLVAAGVVEKYQSKDGTKFSRTIYKLTHEVNILPFPKKQETENIEKPFPKKSISTKSETEEKDTNNNSINNNNINNTSNKESKSKRFTPPTLEEVQEYCKDNEYSVDAEAFIDFYTSKGWMVGKNKMKEWKAAIRTWEKRNRAAGQTGVAPVQQGEKPIHYETQADYFPPDYEFVTHPDDPFQ